MHAGVPHHLFYLLLIRNWYFKTPPDVILQLPDVHSLSTLSILDKLGSDPSCPALRPRKQVLFPWIGSTRQVAVKAIVEARAIVIVVVEELGVERDRTSVSGWYEGNPLESERHAC